MACIGVLSNCEDNAQASKIKEIFPEIYWKLCHICSFEATSNGFKATIRMPFTTVTDVKKFIMEFTDLSKITWRLSSTNPSSMAAGKKNLFWCKYHCQSGNRRLLLASIKQNKVHTKHTGCKARMIVTLKNIPKRCRSQNPHMPHLPTIIQLDHLHNHHLSNAEALKLRDVSKDVEEKFCSLYKNSYSPAEALNMHKQDLHFEHGDNYYKFASDRFHCPDSQWCYRLYYKMFNKEYMDVEGNLQESLAKKISEINSSGSQDFIRMEECNNQTVLCICLPMMRRVHRLIPHSGEIVFMDSTGGLDRYNNRVFMLLTHSSAGGLPLAVFITTSETQEAITTAFEMLKDMLGSEGFYGRGLLGPRIFMTDDAKPEQNAVAAAYPQCISLLCIFHVLQASWRWLWDGKNGIKLQDRAALLYLIKAMVFAINQNDLSVSHAHALEDDTAQKYPKFLDHLNVIWEKREQWAVSLCKDLPIQGNNMNISEAAFHVLKDRLMHRAKAYNIIQLLDFIVAKVEPYYAAKLLDSYTGRRKLRSRFLPPDPNLIAKMQVTKLSSDTYSVHNGASGKTYEVNMTLETCSCPVGVDGSACKHQGVVEAKFNLSSFNFIPINDPAMKKLFHEVATGDSNVQEDWYAPYQETDSSDNDMPCDVLEQGECDNMSAPAIVLPEETSVGNIPDEPRLPTPAVNLDAWIQFSEMIAEKLENNPEVFDSSVGKFLQSASKIETDEGLASALETFGHDQIIRSAGYQSVQSTVAARRVSGVGGRCCLQTGPPPLAARKDHESYKRK